MRKELTFLAIGITLLALGGMMWWSSSQLNSRLNALDQQLDQATIEINRDKALLRELMQLEIAYDTLTNADPKRSLIDSLFVLQRAHQDLNEIFDRHLVFMTDSILNFPFSDKKLEIQELSQSYWLGNHSTMAGNRGHAFSLKASLVHFSEQVARINTSFSTPNHPHPSQLVEAFAPADSLFFEEGWKSWEAAHFSGSPAEIIQILHLLQENQLDFLLAEVKWVGDWKPDENMPEPR